MDKKNELGIRYAPVNAYLSVIPPVTTQIGIEGTVELEHAIVLADIKEKFLEAVKAYFPQATDDGEIKYSEIYRLLKSVAGVYDIKDVFINGGQTNISLLKTELPVTDDTLVTLTEGVV